MSKFSYIFSKNTGVRQASRREKFKFLFLKKAHKFDSQLFSWLHWLGRASKLKIMRRNHLLKVHSLVATWFNLLNSSLTLWTCTKSQKDGQNCKNTGVRRAILPKCPSRRANPSIDGRLWHTAMSGLNQMAPPLHRKADIWFRFQLLLLLRSPLHLSPEKTFAKSCDR